MLREKIIRFETVIDHLSGEELGQAMEILNDSPFILDAVFLTGIGKKNRPAGLLQALCLPENEEEALSLIFRHTHTLGIRMEIVERIILDRRKEFSEDGLNAKAYHIDNIPCLREEAESVKNWAKENDCGAPARRFAMIEKKNKNSL